MLFQIALGTMLMMLTILVAAIAAWVMEWLFQRFRRWLLRPPHRPKLMLVVLVAAFFALGIVTAGVWIWALAYWFLGVFDTMEASIYFSLVSFTTLGYGDVLLTHQWRILGGMAAANGLLNFGLVTALLVEALRHLRLSQVAETRQRH
jgi:hypothetical protein